MGIIMILLGDQNNPNGDFEDSLSYSYWFGDNDVVGIKPSY